MNNPPKVDVNFSSDGKISPGIVDVNIEAGATYQDQDFINTSSGPATILLPPGLSPDGCIFGLAAGQRKTIKISSSVPRKFEIPYQVFLVGERGGIWGEGNSPPTMKVGP